MSPKLPEITTPPLSPLIDIPSLPPSPASSPMPSCARFKPEFRPGDGLIDPLPGYGRGMRQRTEKKPWNYQNQVDAHHAQIQESQILEGIAFVAEELSPNTNDLLTFSDALQLAFEFIEDSALSTTADGPNTISEAMALPKEEADKWYEAATKELETMIELGVLELVKLPPGKRAIGNRWVFKVKLNADGSAE